MKLQDYGGLMAALLCMRSSRNFFGGASGMKLCELFIFNDLKRACALSSVGFKDSVEAFWQTDCIYSYE